MRTMLKSKILAAFAITALLCSAANADTVTFNFTFDTYDAGFYDASGTLTATGSPGNYTITGATGTAHLSGEFPFTILGIYNSGLEDNKLTYPDPNGTYLTPNGVGFVVAQNNSDFVQDLYFFNGYAVRLGGTTEIPGTFTLSPVPGPAVGAGLPGLMMAGAGVLGWWRRKRKTETAA